ncbi:transporter [Vibrio orientalis CIP 102891 = ATCC 33934]|uniref:Membrane protein inferred for ABFAE pathway n=1 Tax=Vibrio orientalis CIP 102891 = ATCC 33934 TaxID=675816 RepID=C9QG39_VIBOR|nr:MMPL family transporter [Vibrio orientalis]EEX94540.1 membrane protein inferred for ABFAE pathway [Vibrio orientalis CIP 102891 = ATCC 33934]EGU50408.1 transporter [Vibrio orientalis CIP 102891 = ATCC 33934]
MLKSNSSTSDPWFMGKRIAIAWLGMAGLFLAMLSYQWLWSAQSPIETDILKLLPKNQQNPVAEQAFEAVSNNLSDKVVFVVTAPESQNSYAAAGKLAQELSDTGLFADVVGQVDEKQQSLWAAYYFQHRFQQLTEAQRQRLTQQPQAQVQYVLQSIYNPFSGVTGNELNSDPFLIFRDYLSQLTQLSSAFTLNNGFLSTSYQGQEYILVTATLKDSPYSLNAQNGVGTIQQIEQSLTEQYQVEFYHTGVLFYAEFGTQSAKSEISTIGLFSLLGVVVLIIGVFRSAAPLSLALLSITIGLIAALSVTTWLFGTVHLFSLVFGASLIGVSIDYAFHYLTERLAAGNQWDSKKGLKHIFAAITMGLLTSLIGYMGMLIAPFPGLQQLALFSSIGLAAAYATVVAWYPILAVKPSKTRPLPGQTIWQHWLNVWSKPMVRRALPLTCLIVALVPLANLQYDDDIRQLQAMPESLKQQETFISQLSGLNSSQQMVVVTADDDEQLLQKLEAFNNQLMQWQNQGVIEGFQSLTQYISSTATQKADYELIEDLYRNQGPVLASMLKLTDVPQLTQTLEPVSLQDYLTHSVSEPVRFLYVGNVEGKVASVVLLKELNNIETVKEYVAYQPDMSYLNKAAEISALFADYRIKVMELIAVALLVISGVLTKRYGFTHAITILIPSLIACVAGLSAASAIGSTLNLFNLLALILIIGIGIDYTLFFAEKARSPSTLLAITLSAMTTLLSFGLLSLSETHAIHSFGITVLSGIFVAWLLSPLAIKERHS